MLLLTLLLTLVQADSPVTATRRVEINGKLQTVRQINGRWWTEDNRKISRTSASWLWTLSGGSGAHLVRLNHHRPVDPARVPYLSRSMGPAEVRAYLGEPNEIFPFDQPENHQHWTYYGRDGYCLEIMFSSYKGGIFTAKEARTVNDFPKDVPHLVFRPFGQQSGAETLVAIPPAAVERPAAPVKRVPDAALNGLRAGLTRQAVIAQAGAPAARNAIAGGEELRETLTYHAESGEIVRVKLAGDKVTRVERDR